MADSASREKVDRSLGYLQGLDHPNVARLLSHGSEADIRYYVREWVEGEQLGTTLADRLVRHDMLHFEEIYPLFQQLCRALQVLHDGGIVHGQIDLSHLILTPDGTLKLTDPAWHLAPAREAITAGLFPSAAAPRHLLTPVHDPREEIHAVGIVMYQLLTGISPGIPARQASLVNFSVPVWFDKILLSMLDVDPAARPTAIGPLADKKPDSDLPSPAVERLAAAIAGGLIGAGAGAVTAWLMSASILVGGLIGILPGAVVAVLRGTSSLPSAGRPRVLLPSSFPAGSVRPPGRDAPHGEVPAEFQRFEK